MSYRADKLVIDAHTTTNTHTDTQTQATTKPGGQNLASVKNENVIIITKEMCQGF